MQQSPRSVEVGRIERGAPSRLVLLFLWLAIGALFLLWFVWISA